MGVLLVILLHVALPILRCLGKFAWQLRLFPFLLLCAPSPVLLVSVRIPSLVLPLLFASPLASRLWLVLRLSALRLLIFLCCL